MNIRYPFTVALALISTAAQAELYKNCYISNGRKTSCTSAYDGQTVILDRGLYKSCYIANGRKTSCTSAYDGQTVILDRGLYKSCYIANGRKTSCNSPYDGQTVILDQKIDPSASKKHCCQ